MRLNPYQTYVEDEILTADPVKLVQLLYRGAREAVTTARAKLAIRDVKARSGAVTKAVDILAELSSSLNHERGGELSVRLAALYDYMQRRLLEGNNEQVDAPFAEVEQILKTLEEAWLTVPAETEPANNARSVRVEAAEHAYTHVPPADYVPVSCSY